MVRPSPKKDPAVSSKARQLVVNVKEVYLSWLMNMFRIDLDLYSQPSLGRKASPNFESPRHDRRPLGFTAEGQVILDEEQRRRLMVNLKEDEITKVYLSKRLC